MIFKYPEIGVCGLSCRLCPRYQSEGESRCFGCKTESRMGAGAMDIKGRSKKLHSILDKIAAQRGYNLKLRK
ncbi:MAG: hypothetical protein FIB07_14500 [Candidatus Methanoperedens sp.]|nr:hypothetical protein [Candidatus Methanoperedens sp.]